MGLRLGTQAQASPCACSGANMLKNVTNAGAAMCPSLNRQALKDPDAVEKLIVRQLPRPSARTVWVGDVVAFNSPLGKPSESQIMVRRVAAVEGMDMVAEGGNKDAEEEEFQIPPVST